MPAAAAPAPALPARTALSAVTDPVILSSYKRAGGTGGPRTGLIPLSKLSHANTLAPDAKVALRTLHDAVTRAGGDFRITDAYRSLATQLEARRKYDAWLDAGKPDPNTPGSGYDPKTMKPVYVAQPGASFHNAGRAIDVDLARLAFRGVPPHLQLDRLQAIAQPLGWRKVIGNADESAPEAWHFDFVGPWGPVLDRLGYTEAATCAVLDIGQGEEILPRARARLIQANLHRAGYDVGTIDGFIGKNTRDGLVAAGLPRDLTDPVPTFRLPSRDRAIWRHA